MFMVADSDVADDINCAQYSSLHTWL